MRDGFYPHVHGSASWSQGGLDGTTERKESALELDPPSTYIGSEAESLRTGITGMKRATRTARRSRMEISRPLSFRYGWTDDIFFQFLIWLSHINFSAKDPRVIIIQEIHGLKVKTKLFLWESTIVTRTCHTRTRGIHSSAPIFVLVFSGEHRRATPQ